MSLVHACPPAGSGVMPCCGKTPFEIPPDDRIAAPDVQDDLISVTCGVSLATAWTQGFMAEYWMDRGYGVREAVVRAMTRGVPEHLVDDLPAWNPYDPAVAQDEE